MADLEPRTERTRLAVAGARSTTAAILRGQSRREAFKNTAFAFLLLLAVVLALAGLVQPSVHTS